MAQIEEEEKKKEKEKEPEHFSFRAQEAKSDAHVAAAVTTEFSVVASKQTTNKEKSSKLFPFSSFVHFLADLLAVFLNISELKRLGLVLGDVLEVRKAPAGDDQEAAGEDDGAGNHVGVGVAWPLLSTKDGCECHPPACHAANFSDELNPHSFV